MRFATGLPELYVVPHLAAGESIVAMSIAPDGAILCVLTQLQLQFWAVLQHVTFLIGFPLPKCSLAPGMDIGSRLVWHPKGRSIAVTTIDRRLMIYEADISLSNESAVQLTGSGEIAVAEASSRVCLSSELKLDSGIVTSVATSTTCLLVCTSGGFVVVVHWSTGQRLHVWGTPSLLQNVRTSSMSTNAVVGGSIVFFGHSIALKKSCLVLSDGSLCLLDSSCGNDFTQQGISFTGVCHPGIGATSVSFNARHCLVAVSCTDSSVRFYALDAGNELRRHDAPASARWCEDTKPLEGIVAMRWSPDEETLAVGFRKRGIAVLHHSGACIMSTFTRYDWSTTMCRTVHRPLFPTGCQCLAWDQEGHRLMGTEADQKSFTASRFARLARSMEPAENAKGSICLFEADSVSFFHASDSDGIADNWEALRLPADYMRENFPLRFCCATGDGQHVVAAGAHGCAIFNRRLRRWKLFNARSQEKAVVVVANPCWIHNVCVVLPLRNVPRREFEVRVYSRFHLEISSMLLLIPMARRPCLVACHSRTLADHKCVLAVVDSGNALQLHEVEVCADSLAAPKNVRLNHRPLRTVVLQPPLHGPLAVTVCPLRREAAQRQYASKLPQLFVLQRNHQLVLVDLNTDLPSTPTHGTPPPERPQYTTSLLSSDVVHYSWLDLSAAYAFQEACVLIAFGNDGVHAHLLPCVTGNSTDSPSMKNSSSSLGWQRPFALDQPLSPLSPLAAAVSVTSTHLAEFDVEALPIGIHPLDGFIVFGMEGYFRKFSVPGLYPCYQVNCRPVLYQHRLLLPLATAQSSTSGELDVAVVDDPLGRMLHRLRESGSFVDTLDYLLHSVIDEDLESRPRRTRATEAHDQRRALQYIIGILRRYPEFHEVIVGCVRKIDVAKWRSVFAVVGKPMDFFNDCVANKRIIEAAHIVRVVMMDDGLPQQSQAPLQRMPQGDHSLPLGISASEAHSSSSPAGGAGPAAGPSSLHRAGSGGSDAELLGPLEEATNCARRLFSMALRGGDFFLGLELLRFMTLLSLEIDLPGSREEKSQQTTLSAIERAFRTMWRGQAKPLPAAPASLQSLAATGSFRGGSLPGDAGQLLRHCDGIGEHSTTVAKMLRKYPSLRHDMEAAALQLLRAGKVAQLCAMFEAFQLDLDFFIAAALPVIRAAAHRSASSQQPSPVRRMSTSGSSGDYPVEAAAAAVVVPGPLSLSEIFGNLHAEFGLPRCPQGELPVPEELAGHPLAANPLKLFTATHELLATVTATCTALTSIGALFARHTTATSSPEYACAFGILLLQVDMLKRLVVANDGLSSQMTALLTERENSGYRRLLSACCPSFESVSSDQK
jgi:hypothetical protein